MNELQQELAELENDMQQPDFWEDKEKAQKAVRRYEEVKAELAGENKYDKGPAILTILAGAGGVDAEDFAKMLYEMYEKYATAQGWRLRVLHENVNDHGGLRNITFLIDGKKIYGTLKNESGVHRLVRVSPFNAKQQRHTSFALVEVVPKFDKVKEVNLSEDDLKVDFFRSSGPGGQNVNKRDTAVRITHVPTGITAACDSERSQAANRAQALEVLEAKIYNRLEEERQAKQAGRQISKTTEVEWGSQIRSYVLHPYKMVKDHRTKVEVQEIDKVLEGELSPFIEAEKNLSNNQTL